MIMKKNKRPYKDFDLINEFFDPFDEKKRTFDKENILSIDMHDAYETQCKIKMRGKDVVANGNFYVGDIVEIAPCKIMSDNYTTSFIKDLVFEIPGGKYAIPFGYVQFYELTSDEKKANCDYLYDPNMETIVIKAIKTIKKGEKLALNSSCIEEI